MNSSHSNQTAIEKFIDDLIVEKGYANAPEQLKNIMRNSIIERINDFTTASILAALPNEDVLEIEKMLKEGKTEKDIQLYAKTRIPNFTDFLTKTLLEFRDVYLGLGGEDSQPIPLQESHPVSSDTRN